MAGCRVAQRCQTEDWVLYEGTPYDAKSNLDLMTMAAACGSRLEVEDRESGADATVNALADLIRCHPVAVGESPKSA